MTERIPNEIWADILYHAVAIPTQTFEAWSTPPSFAGGPRSLVTNILLVSSSWYELAEPALYESAILRTEEQVCGLARSTSEDSEKGIRRAARLRHLRIEGGFTYSLYGILEVAHGIVTLFLGFNESLDDSLDWNFWELRRALRQINPSRLFMQSTPDWHVRTRNAQSFYRALGAALPSWKNLERIDTSPWFDFRPGPRIVYPLKRMLALKLVCMTTYTATRYGASNYIPVIANHPLRLIQIRDGVNWLGWKWPRPDVPREKFVLGEGIDMVLWVDFPLSPTDPPAPRDKLPDLPDQVWTRIIGFATHVHGYNYLDMDEELTKLSKEAKINTTRLHVLLVSKRFYRLGLPHMYSIPYIPPPAVHDFVARVNSSTELAKHIRVLYLSKESTPVPSILYDPIESYPIPGAERLSAPLINLVHALNPGIRILLELDGCIPAGATSPLERAAQHLSRPIVVKLSPRNFLKFGHLRHLTLYGGRGAEHNDVYPGALPRLEHLALIDPGPGMFRVFCSMSLPCLRVLTTSSEPTEDLREFLKAHGGKLDILSLHGDTAAGAESHPLLSLCPNATELHLVHCVNIPDKLPFVAVEPAPHRALRRVVCPSFRIAAPTRQKEWRRWDAFVRFLEVHRHKVPALEEFRIFDLRWPMHEPEYRSSHFTRLAQDLHALGIAFADKGGTRWSRFASTRYPVPGRPLG